MLVRSIIFRRKFEQDAHIKTLSQSGEFDQVAGRVMEHYPAGITTLFNAPGKLHPMRLQALHSCVKIINPKGKQGETGRIRIFRRMWLSLEDGQIDSTNFKVRSLSVVMH